MPDHPPSASLLDRPLTRMNGGFAEATSVPAREALAAALLVYARPRRWFRAKTRVPRGARVVDAVPLDGAPEAALVIFEITYERGEPESYVVPLAHADAAMARRLAETMPHALVASLEGPGGDGGALVDGLVTGTIAPALLALARDGEARGGAQGALEGEGSDELRAIIGAGAGAGPLPARPSSGEQSNSNVALGDRVLLKLYRRLEAGPNPELELGRFLTTHPRRPPTPRVLGALHYVGRDGLESSVAIVHELLANDGDGWEWALDDLRREFEGVAVGAAGLEAATARAETLGRRTGDLHLTLSDATPAGRAPDPAFAPSPLTDADRAAAAARAEDMLARTLDVLATQLERLPPPLRPVVERLREVRGPERRALADLTARFRDERLSVIKTRIHGDLHLGQVLCRGDDFVIIDFEGEPGRSLDERRAKASPMRDVVGMLRSFDYAPATALRARASAGDDPVHARALASFAADWRRAVREAYLRGYLETVGEAPFLPTLPTPPAARGRVDSPRLGLMLRFFELERVIYELEYELNNRPEWIEIPLRGLSAIAAGESTP